MTSTRTHAEFAVSVSRCRNDCQSGGVANGNRSVCRCRIASARRRWPSVTKSIGLKLSDARCSGLLGLGKRSTWARHPAAAIATRRWSSTAPQLIIASRPVTSVCRGARSGSKNRWTAWPSTPSTRNRHGWLLCSDGARHANSTASEMTSVSTTAKPISTSSNHYQCDPGQRSVTRANGPQREVRLSRRSGTRRRVRRGPPPPAPARTRPPPWTPSPAACRRCRPDPGSRRRPAARSWTRR